MGGFPEKTTVAGHFLEHRFERGFVHGGWTGEEVKVRKQAAEFAQWAINEAVKIRPEGTHDLDMYCAIALDLRRVIGKTASGGESIADSGAPFDLWIVDEQGRFQQSRPEQVQFRIYIPKKRLGPQK